MEKNQFVYVTYIRASQEKVWQALMDPEFTQRYWMETRQVSEWKPGSTWNVLVPGDEKILSGEILEIDPPKRLVFTWRKETIPEQRAEGYSRVSYELEKEGDSVKLTVIHSVDKPGSVLLKAVSGGWPLILASLKSFLETGEPLEETRRWAPCD
jgi:uncharacterized protein YndB with AHSA1/START domain